MNKQPTKEHSIKGKIFTGTVVSTKTSKTVVVAITSTHRHPLYKKAVKRTRRFLVHNETLTLSAGETVRIQETKPISKMKHFIVISKVS